MWMELTRIETEYLFSLIVVLSFVTRTAPGYKSRLTSNTEHSKRTTININIKSKYYKNFPVSIQTI